MIKKKGGVMATQLEVFDSGNAVATIKEIQSKHHDAFIASRYGQRQIDWVFRGFLEMPGSTDWEIKKYLSHKYNYQIPIHLIPARRDNINKNTRKYNNFEIVEADKKICKVKNTRKMSWRIEIMNKN